MNDNDYSQLSKAERKRLKKERKQQEKEQAERDRDRRKIRRKIRNYGIILLILVAFVGFFYWRSIPQKNAPIIAVTPSSFSFGQVSQAKGTVNTLMDIKNNGNEDLILTNMDTSCGCTSAAIVDNGEEGPRFGMASHGTNPKNWQHTILPGGSSQLKVNYNPNVHPDLRGSVTRSVFIYSNDPRNKVMEVKINAVQTD